MAINTAGERLALLDMGTLTGLPIPNGTIEEQEFYHLLGVYLDEDDVGSVGGGLAGRLTMLMGAG